MSELEKFDIKTKNINPIYPPMVDDTNGAIFCKYFKSVDIDGSTVPLVLEIDSFYVNDKNVENSYDIKLKNIARAGADYLVDFTRVNAPKIK
jgi:flavin reductase (DIM6/NTAB) family NADH-FMN oxidoreductase RutF